jgi:Antitoxin Phd_YefM, type II toxin-antitoxin system
MNRTVHDVQMNTAAHSPRTSVARATQVGVADFRGNLAKYLKDAKAGRPIVVLERGKKAYVLQRFDETPLPSVWGGMHARTEYVQGEVVNACESWPSGRMP